MGTGTGDMIRRCREAGLREPEFTARDGFVLTLWRPARRPESMEARILRALKARALSEAQIARVLGHREISGRLDKTIRLLIAERRIEPTLRNKPNSRFRQYRLTAVGIANLGSLGGGRKRRETKQSS